MKNYWRLGVLFYILSAMGNNVLADDVPERIVSVIIQLESQGNDWAIGDKKYKSGRLKPSSKWTYGPLQIGYRCVADVNKRFKTNYKAEDCLGNRELSVWIFNRYMEIYATSKALGHDPTSEDYFSIWNGGPSGWKSFSTRSYVSRGLALLRDSPYM